MGVIEQSPVGDNRFPEDPNKLQRYLGELTTGVFRAAVMCRTPSEREGLFESILYLRKVSDGNALIADRPKRAVRDAKFADLVGQLNEVGLGLSYEDTSIRMVVAADSEGWYDSRLRSHNNTSILILLQIFFASPGEYVDKTGKFLSDLDAKSLEFQRGRLGGFVFDAFGTAGDHGHRKPGSRLRRWQDRLGRPKE